MLDFGTICLKVLENDFLKIGYVVKTRMNMMILKVLHAKQCDTNTYMCCKHITDRFAF